MAVVTNTYLTYDTTGIREELADVIYDISPIDCPVMSSIGRGSAHATQSDWQTDELAAAATNSVVEGNDTTFVALSPTKRPINIQQISEKPIIVSGTNEATLSAGRSSEVAYQVAKAGRELKRDMEYGICDNQAGVTGGTAVARRYWSIQTWMRDNVDYDTGATAPTEDSEGTPTSTFTAGTARAFLETQVKSVIKQCWDEGGNPTLIVVGSFNKQVFSTFAGNSTRNTDAEEQALVAAVSLYVSDFGTHRVVADRFSDSTTALVLDPTMMSLKYLRSFQQTPLAKTGDAEKRLMNVEYTLCNHNKKAHGMVGDLSNS